MCIKLRTTILIWCFWSPSTDSVLPNASIIVYLIGPKCGLTKILTHAFSKFDPLWNSTYGTLESLSTSKLYDHGKTVNNSYKLLDDPDASLAQVANIPYSISYTGWINYKQAKKGGQIAAIQNRAGVFVQPSYASVRYVHRRLKRVPSGGNHVTWRKNSSDYCGSSLVSHTWQICPGGTDCAAPY